MNGAGKNYPGHCHCGAIGFDFQTAHPPDTWSLRACQCRFCRCHDALSTSDPAGTLRFNQHAPAQLERYRFGLETADFLLCNRCGVYVGATIETANGSFGIINTHALDDQPEQLAAVAAADYDGEILADRIARREGRWTPIAGN